MSETSRHHVEARPFLEHRTMSQYSDPDLTEISRQPKTAKRSQDLKAVLTLDCFVMLNALMRPPVSPAAATLHPSAAIRDSQFKIVDFTFFTHQTHVQRGQHEQPPISGFTGVCVRGSHRQHTELTSFPSSKPHHSPGGGSQRMKRPCGVLLEQSVGLRHETNMVKVLRIQETDGCE